mmetsp:Transcript_10945/g.30264  ORF Transcript_10945/g.30264 Transcript_10945/m.30264 type:complete len:810 (+) Transcript_10945:47-2476(+)
MPNGLLIQNRKEKRKGKRRHRKGKPEIQRTPTLTPTTTTSSTDNKKHPRKPAKRRGSDNNASTLPTKRTREDPYVDLDPGVASKLRREDAEIAELEEKLGSTEKKEKSKLNREYAKEEGYGDDFGDFLDGLDDMVYRIQSNQDGEDAAVENSESSAPESDPSESDEESVAMKPPNNDEGYNKNESSSGDEEASSQDSDSENSEQEDQDPKDTYKPSSGEDIYGNKVNENNKSLQQSKYVPPHMRDKGESSGTLEDKVHQETLIAIRRSLNNSLNRLSEDTLVTVAQSISRLYTPYPTAHVNDCIWENTRNACVARSYLMTGLTPIYAASLVGVHIEKGDSAQLAQHLIEMTVADLFKTLPQERATSAELDRIEREREGAFDKEACNLVLLLCYLYNFDLAHCSLIYDIIRDLIKSFKEIDIELLLVILSHCGRSLRSDDPSGLKDIVLEVQQRVMESDHTFQNESRVDYMVSALMDLKNNKRRQQDTVHGEKTGRLRKLIGQLKAASQSGARSGKENSSSLRIRLKDILEAETKGRWWKVGASWEGNQYKLNGDDSKMSDDKIPAEENEEEDKLLRLAAKYRMNSDTRRSIFCIIMGSADFEDAFEKLVKAGMLKNKAERDTSRVLMECCGNEKTYNSFYEHLVKRICEYQPQSKFSLQLAYWDSFKQFESMKPRKAANLAKLLFSLVVKHRILRISVLKGIDMTSPDDLSEIGMIFLTLFFTTMLDHFDDPADVVVFFERGMPHSQKEGRDGEDEDQHTRAGDTEALYASFSLFFVQVLKDYGRTKGSKFRSNLKAAIKACDTDNFFM